MREAARIAGARGLNQRRLADKLGTQSGNVDRFFAAKKPQRKTFEEFAAALSVPVEYLLLADGERIEESARAKVRNLLLLEVDGCSEFQADTDVFVRASLEALPAEVQLKILTAFQLGRYRDAHLRLSESASFDSDAAEACFFDSATVAVPFFGSHALEELSKVAKPYFDLAERRRERIPGEWRFHAIWLEMIEALKDPADFDVLLAHIRALHKKNGIEVLPMDQYLEADPSYRSWRDRGAAR